MPGRAIGATSSAAPQQELVVGGVRRLVVGVLEQQRSQDRRARAVRLVEERVQVGQQPLPKPQQSRQQRLVRLAEAPRLLRGVVSSSGCGRTAGRCRTPSSASAARRSRRRRSRRCRRRPGDARQPQVLQLRHAHPQVLPPGRVVARPVERVALQTGVARRAVITNGRRSGRSARRPSWARAPSAGRRALWTCACSRALAVAMVRDVVGQRRGVGTNTVGSFMSHQMPATPGVEQRARAGRPTTRACAGW